MKSSLKRVGGQTFLINTALQRGNQQRHKGKTASAVFASFEETAEAVQGKAAVLNHLAEGRC
jgi:hypothetical protein